jgi:hypothetical protein
MVSPPSPIDAGASARCIAAPSDAVCEFSSECSRYSERIEGPNGDAFWAGIYVVCNCHRLTDSVVTSALVVRELGKSWSIVTAECETDHGLVPATYLRESTSFAMPTLAKRSATVRPAKEYFARFMNPVNVEKPSGKNLEIALRLRENTARLREARWVRFADAAGGYVTDFVVGFTLSGYLVGFYIDFDRL